jgi:MFS transporter, NNP family, nitrate/nitrite transporter
MVNLAFRQSFLTLKNGDGAYIAFIAFYAVCCLVTWAVFMRQRPMRSLGL